MTNYQRERERVPNGGKQTYYQTKVGVLGGQM